MNHFLEILLFIILFFLVIYLFFAIAGLYQIIQQDISNSELKMNDYINELKTQIINLQKNNMEQ